MSMYSLIVLHGWSLYDVACHSDTEAFCLERALNESRHADCVCVCGWLCLQLSTDALRVTASEAMLTPLSFA